MSCSASADAAALMFHCNIRLDDPNVYFQMPQKSRVTKIIKHKHQRKTCRKVSEMTKSVRDPISE